MRGERRDDDTRGLDQNGTDNYKNDNKQSGSTGELSCATEKV